MERIDIAAMVLHGLLAGGQTYRASTSERLSYADMADEAFKHADALIAADKAAINEDESANTNG